MRNSWLLGVGPQNIIWLVGLSLTLFILLLPSASYVAALPFIKQEWDLNNTQAGMVYSGYMAGYALSALLVIPMTDRLATKYIFIASAVISVTTQVLFPLVADGMVSGTVLMAFAGVGLVGVYMPGLRVISERFKDRGRGMAMGAFVTFSYGAHAASLASTGGLMSALEWRDAYLLLAVASTASLPVGYLLLRGHHRSGMRPSSGRLDLRVLQNRAARLFILGYSLHAMELYAVRVWLPAFLAATLIARGTDDEQAVIRAATVGGIALTAGALGPVVGGVISDRWGRATSAAAIFALKLTGSTLNIYSQIGLIMLVGLMAKNGILVVEFADQMRDRGHTVLDAVRAAALTRLRPVMMTMLSTVLGALPLILGSGPGAEARSAIGWVVFGGLGIATVFTLVLIPVIYSLLAPLAPPRAHAGIRLDRELREAEAPADGIGYARAAE